MKIIQGGVTAPSGYTASAVLAGIKPGRTRPDLALIVSDRQAAAAACNTRNLVKGAPNQVTEEHLRSGRARAVICNAGNANTCTGPEGLAHARSMAALAGAALGFPATEVIVASTGVIGQKLDIAVVERAIPALVAGLSASGGAQAREAILTTDTRAKEMAVEFQLGGKVCRMGGIAKGSGMIHPNMATMLSFITTDCAIEPALLREALGSAVEASFNCLSVDGDTSTNDMVAVMANGAAGNALIAARGQDYLSFCSALEEICSYLAREVARDGEGASRLLECRLSGARTVQEARILARSVISSSLVKAAFFGADANWGRILCALGYAGVAFDPLKVSVAFSSCAGRIAVCEAGGQLAFDEAKAKEILERQEIGIEISMGEGEAEATAWGCDLTYDYVKINGDYRS